MDVVKNTDKKINESNDGQNPKQNLVLFVDTKRCLFVISISNVTETFITENSLYFYDINR